MANKVTKKATKKNGAGTTRKPQRTAQAKASAEADTNGALSHERIRARAYEIYRTGRNPSDPTADWYQAEQELGGELGR